jgi:ABC-type nickel/cobalt efflux system permease component RcnA
MISYIITGIVASAAHVMSGPDHLAAVTPLAIESKKKSWSIGFAWGLGHTLGMLIIGLIFILFKQFVDVELISTYGEKIVGFLLILIGIWVISKIFIQHGTGGKHVHPHSHGDVVHVHDHEHENHETHTHPHSNNQKQNFMVALGIGTIHGIAGVSHIIAILPTLALPSTYDSVAYLAGFTIGTITSMILFSVALGLLAQTTVRSKQKELFIGLKILGGIMAIAVGVFWIYLSF